MKTIKQHVLRWSYPNSRGAVKWLHSKDLLRKCQPEAALAAWMAADHWWLGRLGMMAECPWLAALSPLIEIGKRASPFRRSPIITTYDHYRRIYLCGYDPIHGHCFFEIITQSDLKMICKMPPRMEKFSIFEKFCTGVLKHDIYSIFAKKQHPL